jgi:AAA domain
MRFDPTLVLTRLVVERNELLAYNERFHAGVNVIRGENSSGKSTILNFIFYVLGGDLTDWSEAALLCTRVNAEVELNGRPATLSRDVSANPRQPMEIYGGPYDTGRLAPRSEWLRYPYMRSATR